jgi:putative heme iron utilization protein
MNRHNGACRRDCRPPRHHPGRKPRSIRAGCFRSSGGSVQSPVRNLTPDGRCADVSSQHGVHLEVGVAAVAALPDAAHSMLDGDSHRQAPRAVADEMAGLGPVSEVVRLLEMIAEPAVQIQP